MWLNFSNVRTQAHILIYGKAQATNSRSKTTSDLCLGVPLSPHEAELLWQSDIVVDYCCSGMLLVSNDAGLLSFSIVGVIFHVEQACPSLAQCTYFYVCCETVNAW